MSFRKSQLKIGWIRINIKRIQTKKRQSVVNAFSSNPVNKTEGSGCDSASRYHACGTNGFAYEAANRGGYAFP